MLHGAGGDARDLIANIGPVADATNSIILGVDSRGLTWDVLEGKYGPDITFIDQALDWAFRRCAVDPLRMGIGGFSDGASYGLSVGLANGDLFTHVLAFSPGFMVPPALVGKPRIFISHGTQDQVLEIDSTSRTMVPQLQRAGYRVRYREFAGPHTVPAEVAREALQWFSRSPTG
jgi:phospholipase/carboxylesterase